MTNSTAENSAIGVITLDPTDRPGDRHFMDGLMNLPSGADDVSSLLADSTSTSDPMLALKSEDVPPTENGSNEVSNTTSHIQPQAAETYQPTNQRLVSEDDILQVSNSPFVAPQPFSTSHATASRNVVLSNLDDDPPVPIIIPDDSGFKRPECRHIRKKKRPSNADDHSLGLHHACDDCETDFENEQLQQQQQIRPLVILSSMSLQSHHSSTPQESRQGNPQPIEPTMHYSYPMPQSMILDIQPTVEEQIVPETSNSRVEDDASQMYQGIQYVATINLPSQETTPSVYQESEEPRKEKPPEQETASTSGSKTFSAHEVARMVRAEWDSNNATSPKENNAFSANEVARMVMGKLDSSRATSTKENNAQRTQTGKSSVDKVPTEKQSSSKLNSLDQTSQPGRTETEAVDSEKRQLPEKPQTEKPSGKGTVVKPLVRQPQPEKPETLQGRQSGEKSQLSMQQTGKPDREKTPTMNTIPQVTQAEKTIQTQTPQQQVGTKQHEEKAKDRPLPTAKPLSTNLSIEKTNPRSHVETLSVEKAHGDLWHLVKPPARLHSEKLQPGKSTPEKVRSSHEKSHTGKSTQVEASSEKPPVQHIYPTRNPHIDHSILNTAHDKVKPRSVASAPSADIGPVTGKGAIKVKKTFPATATMTAAKSINKSAMEERDTVEVTPRMTRARNSTVTKVKQPAVPERRPLPRNDRKSTENTTEGNGKQGEHTKVEKNERAQRPILNIVKEQGSAKRKAKTVFRSPTTLDPEPVSTDTGNKIMASKTELETSRQTTARTPMEDVNAKEDIGKNVGIKGRITRQKAGLQNQMANSSTKTFSGKKADASEGNPTSGSNNLGKAVTRKSKVQNEKETSNYKTKATGGKSAANMTTTESEQQEPTQIIKASNVYDYNENDEMENFPKLKPKRKRKQLSECIVHLHQIHSETLSTVLSTGSVTVTDDSSTASSEISKTTDTRLGDDEHDDENVTVAKESYSGKKIKRKRLRKRKGFQLGTDKQNGEKNDDKPGTANPVEPNTIDSNPKNGLKGSQGFKEIDFPYSKNYLKGNPAPCVAGSKEINNNNILPVPGAVVSLPITTTSYAITSSLLSSRTQAQIQSERHFPADILNREHQSKSSKTPEIVSRLNSSNSTASGSESDVDPLRYDRGLSGRSSPESIMLTSAPLKIPQPELSYVRAEPTVNSTRLNGSSQRALQSTSLQSGAQFAPTFALRRIQSSVAHSTGAIQAALSIPPSPIRDGQPVWPKTFSVVKTPDFEISKTSGESLNISHSGSLKPITSNNKTAPNTSVATETFVSSRTEERLLSHPRSTSGSSEILVPRTTRVTAAVRSSVAATSVRITKQPELLKARPYGEIQPARPSGFTKPVGTTETPRFPTPTLIQQQQIVRELPNNPPTSQLKIPQASNSLGSIGSQPTRSTQHCAPTPQGQPTSQLKIPQASNSLGSVGSQPTRSTQHCAPTPQGQPTGTVQAYETQGKVGGIVGQTNVIFNPRMTKFRGQRQIVPTNQVKPAEQPRLAGPRGPSNTPGGPTQQSLLVGPRQQPPAPRSAQQPKLTGSEASVSSPGLHPRVPVVTPVRYVGSTQFQTFSKPTQIQVTAARSFEPILTGSLTTMSSAAKPRVPGAASIGLTQTQASRPLQIQELQTRPITPRMTGSAPSTSSGAQLRVPEASSVRRFRPPQSQLSIRPYQMHATPTRLGGFHPQIKLPATTQTIRTRQVHQQPRPAVLVRSPTQAAPTLARLVGSGLSQPASVSDFPFSSRTITSSTLSRSEATVSSTFPVTCHQLAKTTLVTTEQQSAIDNQTSVVLMQTNIGPAELHRIPQQQGSQNRPTYPAMILANPMPDGRAPPPTIVRLPGPPPNTHQVGPVHIAAVPIQGPTEPYLQEILEAVPSLNQTLESLAPAPRASFIKSIQQDEWIKNMMKCSQLAKRQIEMAFGQSADIQLSEEARRLLLLAGGFQPTEGTRLDLTPVRPPAYPTVTQARPTVAPAVITAVPIKRGQPIPKTQNPPSCQPVAKFSTTSQVATNDSLTDQRIENIHDNISEISTEELPIIPETKNRKRPTAEPEVSEAKAPLPKKPNLPIRLS